jgi:hypothetical protein
MLIYNVATDSLFPRRRTALLFVLPKNIAPYVPRRTPQPKLPIIANLLKLPSDLMTYIRMWTCLAWTRTFELAHAHVHPLSSAQLHRSGSVQ